jgi:hypothetical protein
MNKNANQVIYSSDLIIRDSTELATLCVFYDKVFLPYTSQESSRKYTGPRILSADLPKGMDPDFDREFIEDVNHWWERNKLLFEHQVIERLAPGHNIPAEKILAKLAPSERLQALTDASIRVAGLQMTMSNDPFGKVTPKEDIEKGFFQEVLIKQDLVLHFLRTDLKVPKLLISEGKKPPLDYLKALEARATFSYLIPTLGSLNPEEILNVRTKVKDTREGFSMQLQQLSRDIEDRLRGGESSNEIAYLVKTIIETKLVPYYHEFKRQLAVERTSKGKRILDLIGRISEIDVAPSTPRFWAEFLKALGLTLPSPAEQKEKLSNESQAFQFMRIIEDIDK